MINQCAKTSRIWKKPTGYESSILVLYYHQISFEFFQQVEYSSWLSRVDPHFESPKPWQFTVRAVLKIKKGIYAHYWRYVKQRKQTEPFFGAVGNCNKVQHLHHLYNSHVAGIYGPFINKVIDDSTLPTIKKAFVHDPIHPLLASSDNGINLIYVPTIYSAFDSSKQSLTKEELVVINNSKLRVLIYAYY